MATVNDRIAYKPLDTSAKLDGDEDYDLDEDVFLRHPNRGKSYNGATFRTTGSILMNLYQLRTLLYLVVILLFILFIAQLFPDQGVNSSSLLPVNYSTYHNPVISKDPSETRKQFQNNTISSRSIAIAERNNEPGILDLDRPKYDSYLTSVLQERNSRPKKPDSGEPIDDLHYPNDDHQLGVNNLTSAWWLPGQRNSNKHITVTNYVRAMKSFNYLDSITLTTQASIEFLYHTLELCKRWDGPVSVSVFCPGVEMSIALTLIKYMRQCLPIPLSACIRDKVSWHIVYNRAHGPPVDSLGFPKSHLDSSNYPLFANQDQCPKLAGPEPSDTIMQFTEALRKGNGILSSNYRQQFNIQYPINVLRNTARQAAQTKYVLASDIELYPSINLVPMFVKYMKERQVSRGLSINGESIRKYIFTLPIFEVKSNVTAPKSKHELIELINKNDAIFFHKWVCDECQSFPNRLDWLQTDKFGLDDYHSPGDELVIFEVTQRDKTKRSWEPIFIGTNEDPPYDDRLTWDGRRDKMAQMYEMCLQDYRLLVLGNAFLVHAPGIKHIDRDDIKKRLNFIMENNSLYTSYISKLKQQYSDTSTSQKC